MAKIRIEDHDLLGSTQDQLFANLQEPEIQQWSGVLANRQSRGRGTRSRSWLNTEVSGQQILFSLGTVLPKEKLQLPLPFLSLVAIDSLWQTLKFFDCPMEKLAIKWPNDLCLTSADVHWKKTAGILLELKGSRLLVGMGVNLVAVPSDVSEGGALSEVWEQALDFTDLSARRRFCEEVAKHFILAFETWTLDPTRYSARLVQSLMAEAFSKLLGRSVKLKSDGKDYIIRRMDSDGALWLGQELGSEIRVVSSEELDFGSLYKKAPSPV